MTSSKEALRRQRRRELDARRSKSRVRLGSCLQSWGQLKDRLGFSLHSELAHFLLESYFSKACIKCSGSGKEETTAMVTSEESLHHLVLLVHTHGQQCSFPPTLQPGSAPEVGAVEQSKAEKLPQRRGRKGLLMQDGVKDPGVPEKGLASSCQGKETKEYTHVVQTELCVRYVCDGGHLILWHPTQRGCEEGRGRSRSEGESVKGDITPAGPSRPRERRRRGARELKKESVREEACRAMKARSRREAQVVVAQDVAEEQAITGLTTTGSEEDKTEKEHAQEMESETGSDVMPTETLQSPENWELQDNNEMDTDNPDENEDKDQTPSPKSDSTTVRKTPSRGKRRRTIQPEKGRESTRTGRRKNNRKELTNDDVSQIGGKRKRKATPRDILPCEFDGCGKIFSSRQYLNHHVKYQHVQQKTFACSHLTCGKSFNFKKHLKEHEKLHSNQRDYICEFCARAFRTSSNLIIHHRIHTGEKPLQCEVCGFTCRQKASLNWHMRKHNAESSYQFPCEICGRRFEKRDNVTAHRSKSHPDHVSPTSDTDSPLAAPPEPASDPLEQKKDLPAPSDPASDSPEQERDPPASPALADTNEYTIVVI